MTRKLAFWNRRHNSSLQGRRRKPRPRRSNPLRFSNLGVEQLESRLVLSANPILTVVADQFVNEGALLSIPDIGTFTDEVEGSSSGSSIGLDPMSATFDAYVQPAFNPSGPNAVVFDTTNLSFSGGASGIGTSVGVDLNNDTIVDYQIAVFIFSDFDLADYIVGADITAIGDKPLAILSRSNIDVVGTIDVSAPPPDALLHQLVPGPGGGKGGDNVPAGQRHGDPAAGAPLLAGGQLGIITSLPSASGSGGGFGGAGGKGETLTGSTTGLGGIANANLTKGIQGGSGGSASNKNTGLIGVSGGGGGGGIELGAFGTVTISGQVLANGGRGFNATSGSMGGGGGAGGGILVHGNHVDIEPSGVLSAKGGDGGRRGGGGGGGGAVLLVSGSVLTIEVDGTIDVSGGAVDVIFGQGFAELGAPGTSDVMPQGSGSTPVDETYDYVIDWGDGSTDSTPAATIDVPGAGIGTTVEGSFDGSHTYADDDVYTVTVTVTDSSDAFDTKTFTITVANVDPTADDDTFSILENSPNGTVVGSVSADDPGDDALSFGIVGGTGSGAFSINPTSGQITVSNSNLLDFETSPTYTLEVEVSDGDGGTDTALITVNLLNQASISGVVFVDVNQNGQYDANEPGIDGVLVDLLDQFGNPVLDGFGDAITAITSDGGYYLFEDLDPGTYQLFEHDPSGVNDGGEDLGSLGGTVVTNDRMQLTLSATDAFDYAFAELGQQVTAGDAASIGFWQNKHGQALITQGGAQLANWLTTNFENIFGNTFAGTNATGTAVATFYRDQLFKQTGKKSAGPAKVDAQFMAVALATYFTSGNLAGNAASAYGFNVTDTGIGTKIVNVGSKGAAFCVANGTNLTILQLLLATNERTDNPGLQTGFAAIYDTNGDGAISAAEAGLRTMANDVFSSINEGGGV